jgi:hypothetical protein
MCWTCSDAPILLESANPPLTLVGMAARRGVFLLGVFVLWHGIKRATGLMKRIITVLFVELVDWLGDWLVCQLRHVFPPPSRAASPVCLF